MPGEFTREMGEAMIIYWYGGTADVIRLCIRQVGDVVRLHFLLSKYPVLGEMLRAACEIEVRRALASGQEDTILEVFREADDVGAVDLRSLALLEIKPRMGALVPRIMTMGHDALVWIARLLAELGDFTAPPAPDLSGFAEVLPSKCLVQLYEAREATGDVEISSEVEGSMSFRAHKFVLVAMSGYFRRYFKEQVSQGSVAVAAVAVVTVEVALGPEFEVYLRYIYLGGEVNFREVDPLPLLPILKHFEMREGGGAEGEQGQTDLQIKCDEAISSMVVTSSNCLSTLKLAHEYGLRRLEKKALSYIATNYPEVEGRIDELEGHPQLKEAVVRNVLLFLTYKVAPT